MNSQLRRVQSSSKPIKRVFWIAVSTGDVEILAKSVWARRIDQFAPQLFVKHARDRSRGRIQRNSIELVLENIAGNAPSNVHRGRALFRNRLNGVQFVSHRG